MVYLMMTRTASVSALREVTTKNKMKGKPEDWGLTQKWMLIFLILYLPRSRIKKRNIAVPTHLLMPICEINFKRNKEKIFASTSSTC